MPPNLLDPMAFICAVVHTSTSVSQVPARVQPGCKKPQEGGGSGAGHRQGHGWLCMGTGCAWGQSRLWRRKQPLGTTLSLMSKVAAARLPLTGLKRWLMVKIPVQTLPDRLVWGSLTHRPKSTGTVSPHTRPRVALCWRGRWSRASLASVFFRTRMSWDHPPLRVKAAFPSTHARGPGGGGVRAVSH